MKDYFFSLKDGFIHIDEFELNDEERWNCYVEYDLYFKDGFLYLLKVDMTFLKLGIYSFLYKNESCLPLRKSKYDIKQLYHLQNENQIKIDNLCSPCTYILDSSPDTFFLKESKITNPKKNEFHVSKSTSTKKLLCKFDHEKQKYVYLVCPDKICSKLEEFLLEEVDSEQVKKSIIPYTLITMSDDNLIHFFYTEKFHWGVCLSFHCSIVKDVDQKKRQILESLPLVTYGEEQIYLKYDTLCIKKIGVKYYMTTNYCFKNIHEKHILSTFNITNIYVHVKSNQITNTEILFLRMNDKLFSLMKEEENDEIHLENLIQDSEYIFKIQGNIYMKLVYYITLKHLDLLDHVEVCSQN